MHWAESHHNMWFYMGSAKMHHKQIPYVHITKSKSICMGHLSLWIHPSPISAAQSLPLSLDPWALLFQDGCKTKLRLFLISSPREISLPWKESVSGIPASSQFNPSLPSMPDHSSVTNYHCWTVVIRISLLFLSLLEVFRPSQKFWGRLSWELELLWAIGRWLIQRHVLVLAQCPYFSGELSPCWLSKSDASRSSRSGFWRSATAFLTTSNLFSLWDQSWAILTTGAPMFVCLFKKAVSCPHLYTNQLLKCFCLLPCVLSLSPCSLQHLPVTPLPSVFSSYVTVFFLCFSVLIFVFLSVVCLFNCKAKL